MCRAAFLREEMILLLCLPQCGLQYTLPSVSRFATATIPSRPRWGPPHVCPSGLTALVGTRSSGLQPPPDGVSPLIGFSFAVAVLAQLGLQSCPCCPMLFETTGSPPSSFCPRGPPLPGRIGPNGVLVSFFLPDGPAPGLRAQRAPLRASCPIRLNVLARSSQLCWGKVCRQTRSELPSGAS